MPFKHWKYVCHTTRPGSRPRCWTGNHARYWLWCGIPERTWSGPRSGLLRMLWPWLVLRSWSGPGLWSMPWSWLIGGMWPGSELPTLQAWLMPRTWPWPRPSPMPWPWVIGRWWPGAETWLTPWVWLRGWLWPGPGGPSAIGRLPCSPRSDVGSLLIWAEVLHVKLGFPNASVISRGWLCRVGGLGRGTVREVEYCMFLT